jgi:tRNA dimethylallyltransferase
VTVALPAGRSPALLAILGPTATGKSQLGIALARWVGGEILNCDSTAVYRRFDIGTDKVPLAEREGVPHHLIDIVEPTAAYSAAHFARDAARVAHEVIGRGRVPILVGGTGFYYRALTRGLFPGPGRDEALRARLEVVRRRRGVEWLHRWLRRVDPASADRIHARDAVRVIRALEVYRLTGRPLTAHFADTRSPLDPSVRIVPIALSLPSDVILARVTRRVDAQFAAGVIAEVEAIIASGVPPTAHPFTGLVYKEVLELLQGQRDEAATRALIVRENREYARRQLIWFRKEPNLTWFNEPGESATTQAAVMEWMARCGLGPRAQEHP